MWKATSLPSIASLDSKQFQTKKKKINPLTVKSSKDRNLMLFKTAILSHLTYCHLVWHFCRASDSRKIERMQERGLRAVFRNNVSYPELLKRAELPSLQNRRLQDICVLMYKAKNNLCPPYISDIFIKHRSKYNLRQCLPYVAVLYLAAEKSDYLCHLGPNLWGKLSPDLREVTTLKCFKNKIRTLDIVTLMDNGCKCCHLCKS